MIKNHFKIAFRYLKNHLQFTIINVVGLTLGFFCFFLLNIYVLKETSFDQDQKGVYRLLQKKTEENGTTRELAQTAARVGIEAQSHFNEIESQTQIVPIGRTNVGNNPDNTTHEELAVLDDNFLKVFNFPLVEGSVEALTDEPHGVILTRTLKEKYFGKELALNKILKTGYGEYTVVGVLEDFPENSHFQNLIFFTTHIMPNVFNDWDNFIASDWSSNNMITYVRTSPNIDLLVLGNKITKLTEENYPADEVFNSSFSLQPIQNIHLYENEVEGEINKNKGNELYVKLFFWIALLILVVACFNYAGLLNIAFMDRSKEIGLRQIIGAGKRQLLWQFLTESFLLVSISVVLAYTLLWASQPLIKSWFDTTISLSGIPIKGMLFTVATGLILSLLSVLYPFWLIIRTGTSSTLKQTVSAASSKLPFRRFMLVFQFVTVIAFLTASFVFNKQMNFLENKELGFEMDGIVTVDINSRILRSQFEAIKEEFIRIPEVESVSVVSRVPGEWKNIASIQAVQMGEASADAKDLLFIGADKDFLKTFQINLVDGVNFSGIPSDSTKVLINNKVVETLGLENPTGKYIEILGDENEVLRVQVAGVVEDFQMEDFRTAIKPLIIGNWNNPIQSIDYYTMQVSTTDWSKTMADLNAVNDSFDQATPAEINILSDKFERFFEQDKLRFRLLNLFSGIVVFLACMGLFAMSAFVAKSRTKEIGIRKVLGSSVLQLTRLLSQDFVKLVFIGLLIATPITWYLLQGWLSDFAFHIDLKWWMIGLAGFGCLALTVVTVSFQSIRAAIVNPVKSLRTE
ncbi:putative ABC transport system permease protein [Saonia flava]|uniref:Putative ABC transport system permease protein n=1 Tax=Saonia flava TaxID=523696 RepID=A0A846QQ48_9FLAO|nr:ABC transporter permease [Saonia flava]NJB70228.1 putative ABC transport system permease protein [Saonia flava]